VVVGHNYVVSKLLEELGLKVFWENAKWGERSSIELLSPHLMFYLFVISK